MRTTPALLALPLLVAGCTVAPPASSPIVLAASGLQTFDSCDRLLDYYQAAASDLVGPYGIEGGGWGVAEDMAMDDAAAAGAGSPEAAGPEGAGAETSQSGQSGPEFSGTNNQEVGVDEADIVKTDGSIIATVTADSVSIVDVTGERVLNTIDLPGRESSSELLLNGSTLIVLTTEWGTGPRGARDLMPAFESTRTSVTRIDLSDPANPVTLGSIRVEGSYRAARMIEDSVRLVMVTEPPGLAFAQPDSSSMRAEDEAERTNRAIVMDSTIDDWVPHLQVLGELGAVPDTQPLLECDDIARPREVSGLSTLSVLTFDVSQRSVQPTSASALVASGDTVYASSDRLVVATSPWDMWRFAEASTRPWAQDALQTDLHTFDISDPDATTYQASGTVKGRLIGPFALDEADGVIRVATTTDGGGFLQQEESQSSLLVLEEDGAELAVTGRVDELGLTEQIQSVRYLSADLAAVVTFRQTDPLYLIDTSDVRDPRVAGELKVPGFSAYLHPIGPDYLLGIGQDADVDSGQTEGLQASLFDIRDLTRPTRAAKVTWPNGSSPVEWDHRAFLYWEPTGQFVLPAQIWGGYDEKDASVGVVTGTVQDGELTEGPQISTARGSDPWEGGVQRSLVIGDDLWTLGYRGLSRFDLATLTGGPVVALP